MILVVDDHADTAELVSKVLRRHGMSAQPVDSGCKALEALETTIPELVVLDVMMPEMDGIEVLRRLRSDDRWKNIPVLMYSADFSQRIRDDALQMGANSFLVKGTVAMSQICAEVGRLTEHAE